MLVTREGGIEARGRAVNGGSVYLSDQKVPIPVSRVRVRLEGEEVRLTSYERSQEPRH